ncbi:MAG: AraC family transcriptional regulator, partial [Mastigocladus sp. ERB_26_1]
SSLIEMLLPWQVIAYIQAHLSEDISLEAIATEVGMSRYYFCRLFKQSTGISPHQYVIKCRIDRAKELLLQGQNSIADVAFEVGFTSQSHFTKHFKHLIGMTPKAYRES